MKHILHIFRKDVTGLSRNLFALMIAGGLCIIPSLYAWFNIYSNWDPYANTSSLKVAVVSEDSGFSSKGSDPVNMGNQVVEQLHDNTGVGWVFPQDTDAALKASMTAVIMPPLLSVMISAVACLIFWIPA